MSLGNTRSELSGSWENIEIRKLRSLMLSLDSCHTEDMNTGQSQSLCIPWEARQDRSVNYPNRYRAVNREPWSFSR
jgi:hypothetical protein